MVSKIKIPDPYTFSNMTINTLHPQPEIYLVSNKYQSFQSMTTSCDSGSQLAQTLHWSGCHASCLRAALTGSTGKSMWPPGTFSEVEKEKEKQENYLHESDHHKLNVL